MTAWQIKASPLTDQQISAALEHIAASSDRPLRDELILWLRTSARLRAHEIAALNLRELWDADGRIGAVIDISKRLAKYSPARTVQITPRVCEALLRFRAAYPDASTIGESFDKHTARVVHKRIEALCGAIGYTETRPSFPLVNTPSLSSTAHDNAPASARLARSATKRSRQLHFRPSDITRAVDAVKRAGLEVTTTEVSQDGSIRLSHTPAAATSQTAYDTWKERRDARSL